MKRRIERKRRTPRQIIPKRRPGHPLHRRFRAHQPLCHRRRRVRTHQPSPPPPPPPSRPGPPSIRTHFPHQVHAHFPHPVHRRPLPLLRIHPDGRHLTPPRMHRLK